MSEMQLLVENQELKRLLAERHAEIAGLRLERDIAIARVSALLPCGTPEEEAEVTQLMKTAVPFDVSTLVSDPDVT
jgi:hypothetical protein